MQRVASQFQIEVGCHRPRPVAHGVHHAHVDAPLPGGDGIGGLQKLATALGVSPLWLMCLDNFDYSSEWKDAKSEIENVLLDLDEKQMERLLEYAKMLKSYKPEK